VTRLTAIAFVTIGLTLVTLDHTYACSVCRCDEGVMLCSAGSSDQAAQALNALPDKGTFRFQLRSQFLSKSSALSPDQGPNPSAAAKPSATALTAGSEHEREYRPSLRASYGISNQLTVSAELPFSFKRIEERTSVENSATSASGFGDAELSLAWSETFARTTGNTWTIGFGATLKAPTGSNNSRQNGVRLDEHLQPGSGSYDWQIGIAFARIGANSSQHASVYRRFTGTNSFAYRYGEVWLYNLGLQQRLSSALMGTVQLDGRYASKDTQDGRYVENTGGSVLYLTPGIRVRVTPRASLIANVQIPVWENLYGVQSEKVVLNTGVSLDL
jgi:hypothetical protein